MFEQFARAEVVLVQQCREGDNSAWRELHRRYFPVAGAFLRKLGVPEDELSDATQEVFLQVFRYLATFRQEAKLQTWLYSLCISQARSCRRRSTVRKGLRALFLREPMSHPTVGLFFSENAALNRVQSALQSLPPRQRETFVLFEMEGQSGKQIAAILNCTEASVWRRLHYARKAIRALLDPEIPSADLKK